ncbi:chaperonin 10-like protein [Leptodontidium sp. MPI-SDFR-AT-0119]|nr:chaperonin 10-like protein [Leptodontidium sp. MPI-SDFR-AT-0119]
MMRAVRFHGREDIRLDQIEIPVCGKGQVKVKPAFVGICGTDLHEYLGGPTLIPTAPHPLTKEKLPVTLGHEFSGTIEEVGEGLNDIRVGDKVAIFPILYDDTCGVCRRGLNNICVNSGAIGLTGPGGGLSEHIVLNRDQVYILPSHISLEVGALVEPLAVGWHAIQSSPFQAGDSILIIGGGPIGLGLVQVLKALGANKIIVSEISPRRQEFAKHFGGHHVLDPTRDNVAKRSKEICDGLGPDVVFDAAGVQAGLDAAMEAVRPGGTVVNIAAWGKPAVLDPTQLVIGEKKYIGVMTYVRRDFEAVIGALESGVLEPSGMVTSKVKLADVVEKGLKVMINDKDRDVKIMVDVQQ